jgi:uncharacterized membrane protein YsdA (DUF1294 family)
MCYFSDMPFTQILIGVLVAINLVSFLIMARDKRRSIRGSGKTRTPEGKLFFLAALFGSVGVYLGMLAFRHKTKKWYFQLGIPLLIMQNIATVYLAFQLLSSWGI